MWIPREISSFLERNSDIVQIVLGPRQVGKTSLLEHISTDYRQICLDDLRARTLAQDDPGLFLAQFGDSKVLIDEAQYAPNLFPALKRSADQLKKVEKRTRFRLTGSNHILMDRAVKEGLTGRASYFELNTLSVSEILNAIPTPLPLILFRGGWPELYVYPDTDSNKYLDNYITSYIEKDIVLSAGIKKTARFLQLLNKSEIGKVIGVDANTVGDWISILERMKILALVQPYSANLSKRITKSPKLYFVDTGLACRLQGWSSAGPVLTSPQLGSLFETLVFAEIYKFILNRQKHWRVFHWRTRDGEEVDFVIQLDNQRHLLIEAKTSQQPFIKSHRLPELNKVVTSIVDHTICFFGDGEVLANQVPITKLTDYLSQF